MKRYIVLRQFADLQDDNHIYNPGDVFPRAGTIVKQERYDELAGKYNKIGEPLIAAEMPEKANNNTSDAEQPAEVKTAAKKATRKKK